MRAALSVVALSLGLLPAPGRAQDETRPLAAQGADGAPVEVRDPSREPGGRRPFSSIVRRPLLQYRAIVPEPGAHVDQSLRVELGAPIPLGPSYLIVLGGYRWDRQGVASLPAAQRSDLHRAFLGVAGVLRIDDEWALNGFADVSYASDLRDYAPDGWAGLGSIDAVWQASRDWALLFGVTVVRIDRRYLPLPTLGAFYRSADGRFAVDVLLPRLAEIRGRVGAAFELFVQGTYEALGWRTRSNTRLTVFEVRAAAGARYLLPARFYLELALSASPFRRGLQRQGGRERRADSAPAASLDLTLGVRLDDR